MVLLDSDPKAIELVAMYIINQARNANKACFVSKTHKFVKGYVKFVSVRDYRPDELQKIKGGVSK